MCGRYCRQSDKQRIADALSLGKLPEDFVLPSDFNVAPTTFQSVICADRETSKRGDDALGDDSPLRGVSQGTQTSSHSTLRLIPILIGMPISSVAGRSIARAPNLRLK
jgi:putative SOS response-associated peptidase YedK